MYVADLKRALELFGPKLYQLYGQGESPMTITGLDKAMHADTAHPRYEERLGSAGVARTGVAVRVVDEDGRELPHGEIGEIVTRSDCVMKGYWNNPEANARGPARRLAVDRRPRRASTRTGFLTLKDRSKDMIISGGANIYPREIEEVLLTHAGVLEAAVVGRPASRLGRGGRSPSWCAREGADVARRRARPALPRQHRPLQAPEGLSLRRCAAQEQLRQDPEDRAAPQPRERELTRGATMSGPAAATCRGGQHQCPPAQLGDGSECSTAGS